MHILSNTKLLIIILVNSINLIPNLIIRIIENREIINIAITNINIIWDSLRLAVNTRTYVRHSVRQFNYFN